MRYLLFMGAFWCVFAHVLVAQDEEGAVGVPSDNAPAAQPHNPKGEERPTDVQPPQTPPKDNSAVAKVINADQSADPVTSKGDAGDEIQRRDLKAQESMARAAWAMFWGAALQIVIGGVSIYLIYLTLRETRRTLTESEKATKAAQDAADASAEGVRVTQALGDAQNRPWLSIECVTSDSFRRGHPQESGNDYYFISLTATSMNHGNSPATSVLFRASIAILGDGMTDQKLMDDFCDPLVNLDDDAGDAVFPGVSKAFSHELSLRKADIEGIRYPKDKSLAVTPIVFGCILYKSPHTVGFRQTRFAYHLCAISSQGKPCAVDFTNPNWVDQRFSLVTPALFATN